MRDMSAVHFSLTMSGGERTLAGPHRSHVCLQMNGLQRALVGNWIVEACQVPQIGSSGPGPVKSLGDDHGIVAQRKKGKINGQHTVPKNLETHQQQELSSLYSLPPQIVDE